MSAVIDGTTILLRGRCSVEDAETLLGALQEYPALVVDISGAQSMHMAVLQILLSVRPTLAGTPADPFLRELICAHTV